MSTDSSDSSKSRLAQSSTPNKAAQKAGPSARSSKPSPRKVAANRRNALRSTGPKTQRGKNNSKYNALKHGILAREVVRIFRGCGESRRAFQELLAALKEELKPEGLLEGLIAEKIAICIWRSRRGICFENGSLMRNAISPYTGPEPIMRPGHPEDLRKSLIGYEILIGILQDVLSEFESSGLSQKNRETLKRFLPDSPGLWTISDANLNDVERSTAWKSWKERIEANISSLKVEQSVMKDHDELEFDIASQMGSIPSEQNLERIHRYEAANDRQMNALLKQLHELQERRRRRTSGGEEPPDEL